MVLENDDSQKKSKQFLVRVEDDVFEFYTTKARKRRVPTAQVLRELMYREMEQEKSKPKEKGTTDGTMRELRNPGGSGEGHGGGEG